VNDTTAQSDVVITSPASDPSATNSTSHTAENTADKVCITADTLAVTADTVYISDDTLSHSDSTQGRRHGFKGGGTILRAERAKKFF